MLSDGVINLHFFGEGGSLFCVAQLFRSRVYIYIIYIYIYILRLKIDVIIKDSDRFSYDGLSKRDYLEDINDWKMHQY